MKANDTQVGGTHYQKPVQVWDIAEMYDLSFVEGLALRYLLRDKANRVEDLEKAIHCLQKRIEQINKKTLDDLGVPERISFNNTIGVARAKADTEQLDRFVAEHPVEDGDVPICAYPVDTLDDLIGAYPVDMIDHLTSEHTEAGEIPSPALTKAEAELARSDWAYGPNGLSKKPRTRYPGPDTDARRSDLERIIDDTKDNTE